MKLTMIILFSTTMLVSASSYSQVTRLTLNFSDVSYSDLFQKIEDQSEFSFAFTGSNFDPNQKTKVNVTKGTLEEILNEVLPGNVTYEIINRYVIIRNAGEKNATASQQQKSITGKVTDSSGQPLPGVTVVVKGTTNGIITDVDGHYSLPNVSPDAILMFSFVGMKTQEISVAGKTSINIVLEEESIGIEEVVAIGYGTARRKDLTGSVASVSGSTLKDIPVTSAAQAIVGRMPGVQVTKTEGSPDADIRIRVRGGGSLTQDNSPLYIVDGFPVGSINDIAPTDIESIDVLKDASSTAIYGARGANGVIIITTKGGFEGKGKISYNTYFGVKNITKMLDVLDPYEFAYWQYEVLYPSASFESYYGDFQDLALYKQMKGTDWQNEVFGRTGTSMYHNLSVTGGSKTSKYNISLTRNDEEEIMIGSGYERTNLTIKTFHKINDWLSIDLNTRLSDYYLKGAGTSSNSRLSHAVQYRPMDGLMEFVDPALVNVGDYETTSNLILNPVNQTNDDYRRQKNLSFNINGAANISFSKNLKYRLEYGTQYGEAANNRFYGVNTSNAIDYGRQPMVAKEKTDSKSYRLANILTYTKRDFLPGNNLTAMVGEELNYSKSEYIMSSAKYFPKYIDAVSALSMMQLGKADPIVTADNPENKTSSFFGRLNYDYKGKYLVSATFRADGSSKFAPGNQWGYFPSAALAWRISDEQFMVASKKWLSDLKLRVSYGESGNNRIADNAWKKTFTVSSGRQWGGAITMDGNEATLTSFLEPNGILSNPDLKWETTITRNIGLDFSLFKQRFSGSVEVYKNTTQDLLLQATIPSSSGYSVQWQNIGQTSNKGIEVVLNGVIIDRDDFKLSASFNIGLNKSHIDKLGATKLWEQNSPFSYAAGPSGEYLIEEGGELGLLYGYEVEGMYSVDDFDYDATKKTYTLKQGVSNNSGLLVPKRFWPGTLKLKDQDGDLVVNAKNDKVVIGHALPKHTGGFNLTAQFKGFDCSAFFNWVYGNDIYNANKVKFSTCEQNQYFKNILNIFDSDHRFTYFDKATGALVYDPVQLAEMNKNATTWSSAMMYSPLHSNIIEDGSFLRLNTLTVGYSLPKNILSKIKISQLRVYASAYNLWTWTNYSGFDPEVSVYSNPLTPGIDWNAYPRSRSYNIGLNVEF